MDIFYRKSKTPLQATGHLSCSAPRGGVFGLRSASVGAKRVPLAHSAPRGSRQMDMQACPLGSLLAGIKNSRDRQDHPCDHPRRIAGVFLFLSSIFLAVSIFPSRPTKGLVLVPNVICRVGSSICKTGRGRLSPILQIVSPTDISAKPAIAIISPASASFISIRL